MENGGSGETSLQSFEGLADGEGPGKGDFGGGQGCEGSCQGALAPDEASVGVSKPQGPLVLLSVL